MHLATGGILDRSLRLRECVQPGYGYGDELRVMACVEGSMWGAFAFFRAPDDDPFTEADVAFASTLSTVLASGFRTGLLSNAGIGTMDDQALGPAVIIVDADDRVSQISVGAEERLRQLQTKDIATALHLSAYTVQDHLKANFVKADARSRRELMGEVFFDQYQPRLGADIAPNGWFTPA